MNTQIWISLAVGAVLAPSVAWLVKEVLDLRGKMIQLGTRQTNMNRECDRHQRWSDQLQKSINRIERNVARLCQAMGVKESE